jgi:two-component system phosphate regulon sensor histidine kinase PhoR
MAKTAADSQRWIMQIKYENRPKANKRKAEKEGKLITEVFLTQFLHDLKTPITVIKGYAIRMREEKSGAITDEQKEALDVIIRNCDKLEHDLTEISEYTKADMDSAEQLSLETFNLKELLENRVESFKPKAKEKEIDLNIDAPSEPVTIQADRRMIDKAVSNLIDNAIKYNDLGGWVAVVLSGSDNSVEIKVIDNGKGLDEAEINLIFKPFEQIDNAEERKNSSMGLGLYNVKKYVEAHQGEIQVESEVGKGSSFTIRLPKRQAVNDSV